MEGGHVEAGVDGEGGGLDVLQDALAHPLHRLVVKAVVDHGAGGVQRPLIPVLAADLAGEAGGGEDGGGDDLLVIVHDLG